MRADREGQIVYALGAYHALKTTNISKLHSFIEIQLLACTREYEQRFGVPNGTNMFDRRFAEAKQLADRIEKTLVPVSAIANAFGSNVQVEFER